MTLLWQQYHVQFREALWSFALCFHILLFFFFFLGTKQEDFQLTLAGFDGAKAKEKLGALRSQYELGACDLA